jgi:cytochrome P450
VPADAASEAERPLESDNLFDADLQESPWEFNARLRREALVGRDSNTGIDLISSFDLSIEVLENWELVSNRFGLAMGADQMPPEVAEVAKAGRPPVDTLPTADPPEQTRFRSLVDKAFSLRQVKALEPRREQISSRRIDGFIDDGHVELRARFAVPLPLTIIDEQLDVPPEDLVTFKKWSDGFVAQLSEMVSKDRAIEAAREIPEGSMRLVRFASADRDERIFPDADRFDVERENASEQIAFGYGIHFCLGAGSPPGSCRSSSVPSRRGSRTRASRRAPRRSTTARISSCAVSMRSTSTSIRSEYA